jgi:rhodanese-related sulfurtransferase/rubrerythrin
METKDYFRPLSAWPADKVREFLKNKSQDEYNLIDVRQPKEYERGHLPGALLIPLDELPDRLHDLDPEKPTITYCAIGIRSRAAAALLTNEHFKDVQNMEGGIRAWHGLVAEGLPEARIPYFSAAVKPVEFIALAWLLEDGSRKFYSILSKRMDDREVADLFKKLSAAEEHHKSSLFTFYKESSPTGLDPGFPLSILSAEPSDDIMEGGIRVNEALQWTQGRDAGEILELSLALETNSFDLYLTMERTVQDDKSRKVFRTLSDEEKLHLQHLTELFEKRL